MITQLLFLAEFLLRVRASGSLGYSISSSAFIITIIMPAALADTSQIICEVWASNVEEEMRKIRQIIQNYNYIAMVCVCVCACVAIPSTNDVGKCPIITLK